jgi:hypothetical protein
MATTYSSDISRLLIMGIKEIMKRLLQVQKTTYYDKCSSKKTSNKAAEYYETIGNISPAQVVAENAPLPYNTIKQGYRTTVTNQKVANGFEVSVEANDDELYGCIDEAKVGGLMRTMISKKEKAVAAIWNAVYTATGGDGVAPASASHPLINSASLNNNTTTGAITPDTIVTITNLANDIMDQAGELFDTDFTQILAHPNQMAKILACLESSLKAYELSNTKNTIPVLKPVFNKYLDKTIWHVRDETIDSVILQERKGIENNAEKDTVNNYVWKINMVERYVSSVINSGYGFASSTGS